MENSLVPLLVDALCHAGKLRGLDVVLSPEELSMRVYRRDHIALQLTESPVGAVDVRHPPVSLRVGPFSFLVGDLGCRLDEVEARLQEIHTLAAIARSWLGPLHEVDLCIIMVGRNEPSIDVSWHEAARILERDETICRKFVWLPPADGAACHDSLLSFIQRSPLARPWDIQEVAEDKNLDAADHLFRALSDAFQKSCALPPSVLQEWLVLLERDAEAPNQIPVDLLDVVSKAER